MLPELHPDIRQRGVLVVDDSPLQRQSIIESLRQLGVTKLFEAGNGRDGLQMMNSLYQPPAVIILDLAMPGMDGIEMVQQLAHEGLYPSVLIASSAEPGIIEAVQTMIEALGLALLGAMHKPLTLEMVAAALATFNDRAPAHGAGYDDNGTAISVDSLRQAIARGHIVPFYQPKMWLENGRVTGLEALARWRGNDDQLIPPLAFIELAEQNGLIDDLTLAMLDVVLRDLSFWQGAGLYPTVAINLSPRSLAGRHFANEIISRVEAARISSSALVFEITEGSLVKDLAAALGTLGRLRLKGFGLSIDDYGTGFSSMQQLSRLPFTELKIDRSFVHHAHEKWQLRTILESAINMGHHLGLTTVAEGVETQEELDLLRTLGCKYAQGYLIAPPMPALELLEWRSREAPRLRELCMETPEVRP